MLKNMTGVMVWLFTLVPTALQAASRCDLMPYITLSPCAVPHNEQSLMVRVYNSGNADSGPYTVGIKVDGQLMGEAHIDEGVPHWEELDVTIPGTVVLEYDHSYQIEAYVRTDTPDANTGNDTRRETVKMPSAPTPNYPYNWSGNTCLQDFGYDNDWWSMGWGFDDQTHAFYISERASNWMGSLSTRVPITFTPGEMVTCSFEYGTSGGDVRLVLNEKCPFGSLPIAETVLDASPNDFTRGSISFVAPGPMYVDFIPELMADFFAYGSFYIRNICFNPAVPDLATQAILSPQFSAVACSESEIPVTVRYNNPSPYDLEHPILGYAFGNQVITETYEGIIAAGTSIDYTFQTPIVIANPASDLELSAWCEAEGDQDESNDDMILHFDAYEPLDFPYIPNFDDADLSYWTTLDADGDHRSWDFTQLDTYHGPVLQKDYGKFEDYLIAPALMMPAGRSRLTFGYWNLFTAARLRVLMGRSPSLAAMTEVLCDYQEVDGLAGYALIDIEEPGIYYFAFEGTGSADQMLLTDIQFDQGDGVCANYIAFDVTSGYGLQSSAITIQVANHGVNEQEQIDVYYVVDGHQRVEEVIGQTLQPGEVLDFTFATQADVSAYGTHSVQGGIRPALGDDEQFTTVQGPNITNWRPLQLPYYYGFNEDERNASWTLQHDPDSYFDGWEVETGNFFANSHHTDISASYSGDEPKADFWAFSEGIEIPAGEYEIAFYYRGRSYFGGHDYMQDFDVAMGQGCTSDDMNVEVTSLRNVDSHGCYFDRFVGRVIIPESGIWHIGFHDVSPSNYGQIRIDDVSVHAIQPGLPLPYTSQFDANAEVQWTFHGNDTYYATCWTYTTDGYLRAVHDGYESLYFENLTTSPKLAIESGRQVNVHIDYSISLLEGKAPNLAFQVYQGKYDSRNQMQVIATLPMQGHEADFSFEVNDNDGCYLGLRTNTDISTEDACYDGPFYTLTVHSVSVRYDSDDALQLLPADAASSPCYDVMGQRTTAGSRGLIIRDGKVRLQY